ncbi:unnamed protein product, partial [Ectocarpus sp. 4 AP-2014]
VDPWEDIIGALSPFDGGGRLSSIPGGGRSGRRSPANSTGGGSSSGGGAVGSGSVGTTAGTAKSPVHALPWLQLLAAVLEAYPEGGCWCPQDTAMELARAVSAVDDQLKSIADSSVHLWALVCLLRAAEAS